MKVLIVHNSYLNPGGEDSVVNAEHLMLKEHGNDVVLYQRSNDEAKKLSLINKFKFFTKDAYASEKTYVDIKSIIEKHHPDIAHFHNSFFFVGPSAYEACFDQNVPIVQTLHNYRFLCPNGVFYRNGGVCEDCMMFYERSAVFNKCWHNSYVSSFFIYKVLKEYHKRNIFSDKIDHFIALSEFSKNKFVEFGLPETKISVKPNFVDIEIDGEMPVVEDHGLFVGYLEEYKGVRTLLEAYRNSNYKLRIVGDGPLIDEVKEETKVSKNVTFLGKLPFEETLSEIKKAKYIVYPSVCYETFGRVIIEAFACSKPVIVSDAGASAELVENGITGYTFKSNDSADLLEKINLLDRDQNVFEGMCNNARKEYEKKFVRAINAGNLLGIYNKILESKSN